MVFAVDSYVIEYPFRKTKLLEYNIHPFISTFLFQLFFFLFFFHSSVNMNISCSFQFSHFIFWARNFISSEVVWRWKKGNSCLNIYGSISVNWKWTVFWYISFSFLLPSSHVRMTENLKETSITIWQIKVFIDNAQQCVNHFLCQIRILFLFLLILTSVRNFKIFYLRENVKKTIQILKFNLV